MGGAISNYDLHLMKGLHKKDTEGVAEQSSDNEGAECLGVDCVADELEFVEYSGLNTAGVEGWLGTVLIEELAGGGLHRHVSCCFAGAQFSANRSWYRLFFSYNTPSKK